jgi:hypothetical protein
MKTLVGKIVSLAVVLSTAPLTASAAAPTLDNGMARDLNHLTLLRGPNLTSPLRPIAIRPEDGAIRLVPQPTPDAGRVFFVPSTPEVGEFRYVPQPPETSAVRMTSPGKLSLRKTEEPAAPSTPPAAAQKKSLPAPESLHFDSKLHPTPMRGTIERVREPK